MPQLETAHADWLWSPCCCDCGDVARRVLPEAGGKNLPTGFLYPVRFLASVRQLNGKSN